MRDMGRDGRENTHEEEHEAFPSSQHQLPHSRKTPVHTMVASSNQGQLLPTSLRLVSLPAPRWLQHDSMLRRII